MPAHETIFVVSMPFKVEGVDIERGDRYDRVKFKLDDITDKTLRFTRFAVPLTPESYRIAITSRALGTVGRGFTVDELLEWGIIDASTAEGLHAAQREGEEYLGYRVIPVKQGHFTRYEVKDARGELMRQARFGTNERARAFIDTLPPAGHDGARKESPDGLHVRSDALQPA